MQEFNGKKLLITGGTGSFGSAALNKFLNSGLEEVRIFSRDEKKQEDMRIKYANPKIKFYIGDVRDSQSILNAMEGIDYVFHAAALKQVPSCEFYPVEAVKTNILGTENVLNAASQSGVEKIVCLSTDKAVYPINAMGMSKAMMEKVMMAKSRVCQKSVYIGTRYGNVMASRGSVIPLFINQILNGQPITITNPHMTRFMMTLEDAVELVQFAFLNGKSGDLFVQKAPAATIEVLAKALVKIFKAKSEIKIIGTRHGEKLYESLLSKEEYRKAEDMGEYFKVSVDSRDLNYTKYFSEGLVEEEQQEDYNSSNTNMLNEDEMVEMLMKLPIVKDSLEKVQ